MVGQNVASYIRADWWSHYSAAMTWTIGIRVPALKHWQREDAGADGANRVDVGL